MDTDPAYEERKEEARKCKRAEVVTDEDDDDAYGLEEGGTLMGTQVVRSAPVVRSACLRLRVPPDEA